MKNLPGSAKHPYIQQQLLNKIYNHISYRSNVFAVWVTVGFFEVDPSGKLGKEIGRAEGRQIRHRMFSIVDRSVFAKIDLGTSYTYSTLKNGVAAGQLRQIVPESMQDIHNGSSVTIHNPGATESATVTGMGPNGPILSGLKNNYDPGSTIKFTANLPQKNPDGSPVVDKNGRPVLSPQSYQGSTTSGVGPDQGTNSVGVDPSVAPYLTPGTQVIMSSQDYEETVGAQNVGPSDTNPLYFYANLQHSYNKGASTRTGYPVKSDGRLPYLISGDTGDPGNPGPKRIWNTRDDHGNPEPICYYSVID
jgi:hypothetical protein